MGLLEGRTALIGGAGRNNGRAIALAFAKEGANLVLIARTRGEELAEVSELCRSQGVDTLPILADLTEHSEIEDAVRQALERFERIDSLVAVAGRRPHQRFWEITNEEWHRVFDVNVHSLFYLARAVAPSMMRDGKGGSIIALGGLASLTAMPGRAHVNASKWALYGLVKSLAVELGEYNIRANLLALSLIQNERVNPEWYPAWGSGHHTAAELSTSALKRVGTPEEVANVAVFLASDQSSFVTGGHILCTGGKGL